MRKLPRGAGDDDILAFIRSWAESLADERCQDALGMVDARSHWTPELLRTTIENYGFIEPLSDGQVFRVTPADRATGPLRPRHEVTWFDEVRGLVHFDLPLNGEWSDVTALFDLERTHRGIRLVLDDVHVL